MLSAFERKIAFRYLRARRQEGLISVIALFSLTGIALGVATLIVVLSVMNGVRDELIKSIIGLEGHVTVSSRQGAMVDYDLLSQKLREMPGIVSAVPKIEGQIMASYRGMSTGALVSGYRQDDLLNHTFIGQKLVAGDASGVLIGSRMAERMGLSIGDEIMLISPEGRQTVVGMVPRVKSYPIGGIFTIGMFAYDNSLIVLPFEEAQLYFKLKGGELDAASQIEIITDNPQSAPELARQIRAELGDGFRLNDWKNSNSHIFQAVIVQRNVMFLILMLIILVASFNIISSLIMLVREKGRDIAILRTMGASRSSIMKIFVVCGASVGVLGTLFGVALGLLIAFNTENIQQSLESMMGHKLLADELYFLSHLPSKVDGSEVLTVVVIALLLSLLATIYPARRAASLNPAEGLRYE
ncbi:MAG: lipoprotein-releasing ABC transporter permease subunit [Rickettsiales bacterium]|nr:lipoprotein-releasing ABC transporter permease subunit [Rickettsiales bacterium]